MYAQTDLKKKIAEQGKQKSLWVDLENMACGFELRTLIFTEYFQQIFTVGHI